MWCQIEQRNKLLCLIVSNLNLIKLRVVLETFHVAVWRLVEVTNLGAETDHREDVFLCHVGSEYPVEDLDGPMVDVIFCRNPSQVSDSKGTTVFNMIDHTSLHKATCCTENQLVSLGV